MFTEHDINVWSIRPHQVLSDFQIQNVFCFVPSLSSSYEKATVPMQYILEEFSLDHLGVADFQFFIL